MSTDVAKAKLRASLAAIDLLCTSGRDETVKALAHAAGISESTFYRYFATREDVLRPALQQLKDEFANQVDGQPFDISLGEALYRGWTATVKGVWHQQLQATMPVVISSPVLMSVWTQEMRTHGRLVRQSVALRSDTSPDSEWVTLVLTVFFAMVDLALAEVASTGEDPNRALRRKLALAHGWFEQAQRPMVL
ncbi:MAG: TetR/AcrR family transcriptional regulator [Propionibacteriaceae bacterium]|nr:TetR/AcrR family transcriptional regulator [Propionibacteriaceae bacterium]